MSTILRLLCFKNSSLKLVRPASRPAGRGQPARYAVGPGTRWGRGQVRGGAGAAGTRRGRINMYILTYVTRFCFSNVQAHHTCIFTARISSRCSLIAIGVKPLFGFHV